MKKGKYKNTRLRKREKIKVEKYCKNKDTTRLCPSSEDRLAEEVPRPLPSQLTVRIVWKGPDKEGRWGGLWGCGRCHSHHSPIPRPGWRVRGTSDVAEDSGLQGLDFCHVGRCRRFQYRRYTLLLALYCILKVYCRGRALIVCLDSSNIKRLC